MDSINIQSYKYLLRAYNVPGTVVGPVQSRTCTLMVPALVHVDSSACRLYISKQKSKIISGNYECCIYNEAGCYDKGGYH